MVSRPTRPGAWVLACVSAVVAAACGDSDPSGPDILNLGGTYDYAYSMSNTPTQLSCNGTGSITITQAGTQFTGSVDSNASGVICTGPGGQISGRVAGQVTGGPINGQSVSFNFPFFEAGCMATGTAAGTPVNNLSGNLNCTFDVSGQTVQLTGTWQASR